MKANEMYYSVLKKGCCSLTYHTMQCACDCCLTNHVMVDYVYLDTRMYIYACGPLSNAIFYHALYSFPPAPSPPSGVTVSQNGVYSVQVSWTPPSEPAVTGYIIYYQQQDGGQNGTEMAGATATTATITRLMTRATYSITMVTTSSTLPSIVTSAAVNITIGMI